MKKLLQSLSKIDISKVVVDFRYSKGWSEINWLNLEDRYKN